VCQPLPPPSVSGFLPLFLSHRLLFLDVRRLSWAVGLRRSLPFVLHINSFRSGAAPPLKLSPCFQSFFFSLLPKCGANGNREKSKKTVLARIYTMAGGTEGNFRLHPTHVLWDGVDLLDMLVSAHVSRTHRTVISSWISQNDRWIDPSLVDRPYKRGEKRGMVFQHPIEPSLPPLFPPLS
jgi:hypothetical protein